MSGRVLASLLALGLVASRATAAEPSVQQLGEVRVIGLAPLPGFDVPLLRIPLNVQSAEADDIQRIHGQAVTDLLQHGFQGVHLTQSQGNPWQANLFFHGFTLSPLLGAPSGISVYLDGVRQNEPFAENMNWEAIPDFAIRDVELVPGSSPLYGLNTLAGALLLASKSGFTDPGGSLDVSGGAWGRIQSDADFGVHDQHFGLYAGVGNSYERGWRRQSPSRVQQVFVRGDWRPDDDTSVALSYTGAHSKLFGTQTLPVEWARTTPKAAYTWPDFFTNNLGAFNLQASRQLGANWALQGNAYLRISQSRGFDSNTNDYASVDDDAPDYAADGPFDPDSVGEYYFAGPSPAYNPLDPAATINNVPGSNVLGNVHTRGFGATLQAVSHGTPWEHDNQLTVGLSLDAGNSVFTQYAQPAYFPYNVPQRGATIGLLPFGPDALTDARTFNRSYGLYFMDVLALTPQLHLSTGGRFNFSRLAVGDLTGEEPDIDGAQRLHRFNPSLGVAWAIIPKLGIYLDYDEGMRAPTPIEFECADADAPCSLPNDFTGDPPLKPVLVRTLSGGLRGSFANAHLHWNVSPYYSRVSNDILTIFTGGSAQGYFANVPRTLHEGVDVGLGGELGRLEWQANFSRVSATVQTGFTVQSEANSSAHTGGVIHVRRGDRVPGVPRSLFNLSGEYHLNPRWSFGGNVRAYSSQYATGDENNQDRHGPVPGYAIAALDLHYQASRRLALFARIDNLFDRHYFVSGQLSTNVFDTPDRLIDVRGTGTPTLFVAPGAPRTWLLGLRYAFGMAGSADAR